MQALRRFAGPGIVALVGTGVEVSGYRSDALAVVLWVVAVLWGLAAVLTWEPVQGFISRHVFRRKPVVNRAVAASTLAAISSVGQVTVSATKDTPWSMGAAEPEALHKLYPHTRGVLLWLNHRDGIPDDRYSCEVTFEGKAASVAGLAPRSDGRIDCIYPKDFQDAPTTRLKDGEYAVEWFREVGEVGRTRIGVHSLERREGKLREGWRP